MISARDTVTAPQRNFGGPETIRAITAALRLLALAVCLLVPCAAGTMAQDPARRVALIVGNANYKDAAPLATPLNDAEDLAAAVTGLGFDVTLLKDASAAQLRQALQNFAEKSAKASLSVVYFGGHSVEFAGENYLVPIDAVLPSESSIRRETIPLRTVTLTVAKAQVLGLIVLDALRPNSFLDKIERGGTREAPSEAGAADGFRNVLQFFAAEAGKTAVEGEGRNSPMTSALLKYVNEPNLEINFLFRNIRDDVRKATRNRQTPYMYGQLSRTKFFLNGTPQSASAAAPSRALGRDPAAVHPCDTHAASPDDATRTKLVKGVRIEDIDVREGFSACQDATKLFPGVSRFPYQFGRVAMARKDYPAALANYTKAFELGNELALQALASMYDDGVGVNKDPARARFYYEVGAEKNFAPAMVSLGMRYERGAGVAVDLAKAYNYYKRAADLGHARAIYNVGLFNEKGIVVPQNAKLARELYEKSATMGDDVAMVNLARLYANGVGGKKDPGQAKDWLALAEQAGNAQAKQILTELNKPKRK